MLFRSEKIQIHICTQGKYNKYIENLDEDNHERYLVTRYFNYGHVPGTKDEWRRLRKLDIHEVILFLNTLGFEKGHDGWWSVPEGVAVLEDRRYKSLSALGKALIRVPDLEDRTGGQVHRRRARKGEQILSDKQLMALRLCIAEGLEDENGDEQSSDDPNTNEFEGKS